MGVDEVFLQKNVIMVRVGNEELNDKRVSSCAIAVKLDDDGNDSDGGRNMVILLTSSSKTVAEVQSAP
ncbi:hypothetical protein L6452_25298 [Arctium lappa]|uniref:Uncharacterized protein n=1 Tax=Arctium lappa TaxID=4217 RepID=A0ACB9AAR4_ARCLA|nr:hypothetical protein L6452_25298 [Arctium lappa]